MAGQPIELAIWVDGCASQTGVSFGTQLWKWVVRRYLILVMPLCAAIAGAPAPGEPAHRGRAIAACLTALELKGLKAVQTSVKSRFRSDHIMVTGKLDVARKPQPTFSCDTHHNNVITLKIGE